MSIARLDEALAALDELITGDESLEQWRQAPIDDDVIEENLAAIAPRIFSAEVIWMAENGGYLPGFSGWGQWADTSVPATVNLPTPNTDTSWFQLANVENDLETMVVPVTTEALDTSPIGFTDRYFSFDIRYPSAATMIESFTAYLRSLVAVDPAITEHGFTMDRGFSLAWSYEVETADPESGDFGRSLANCRDQIAALFETADRSHPCWTEPASSRSRIPQAAGYDDGWIAPEYDDEFETDLW